MGVIKISFQNQYPFNWRWGKRVLQVFSGMQVQGFIKHPRSFPGSFERKIVDGRRTSRYTRYYVRS